jgi:hypothetical protein
MGSSSFNQRSRKAISHGNLFIWLFVLIIFEYVSPLILSFAHPDMQYIVGNPKAVYFYDIDSPSCGDLGKSITYSLGHLSDGTKVRFIQMPPPIALILGGFSYTCGDLTNKSALGEFECDYTALPYYVIEWNRISLSHYSNETVILHETLHNMGFGHSQNNRSIMYPIGQQQVMESDLADFIRTWYTKNPLAYLNIIPLTLVCALGLFLILFTPP